MAKPARPAKSAAPKPAPPLKRNRQPRSCVWWFLMGITVGAVGGNIISTRRADPAETTPGAAVARESTPAPVQPTFQFPQLLNDTKVETIDRPPPPSAPRPQLPPPVEEPPPEDVAADMPDEPPPQSRSGGSGFMVQAGSFKNTVDAERRRAELARLGVSSNVQKGTLPNGQTAYRVRTGVYSTRKAAEQARDLLKRNGKDAVAYPVK
ncbi:SPOR domain-containing protein [Chromatium okenii]|jgi:cell division protein FtsN|uniref:SPOR domain-containing protein n=1 Tax=Chromatium okenii TaxID=61644 RepID=A0A2S7XQ29_9GAMM|nr:SPOR domain-containing protein [Chromatium okenii]MBV5311367.1 SPOR domain-containing protein [Chromatium okenii]PQJ95548.1 SPOR domain-containing protein [Chromatium okenii]